MKYLSYSELEKISGGCGILVGNFLRVLKTLAKYIRVI